MDGEKIVLCHQVYVLKKELGLEFPGVFVCCVCLCVFSSASMGSLHFSNEENPEVYTAGQLPPLEIIFAFSVSGNFGMCNETQICVSLLARCLSSCVFIESTLLMSVSIVTDT